MMDSLHIDGVESIDRLSVEKMNRPRTKRRNREGIVGEKACYGFQRMG